MQSFLKKVVPWGRCLDEYRRMFAITELELDKRFLGCADGPASFNAEMSAAGRAVTSCDPLYRYSADQIRERIDATYPQMIEYARKNADVFVWSDQIPDPATLGRHRMQAMERFLSDYKIGRIESRYVAAELPDLPFADRTFDIALCSHFLFLYSEQLTEQFHIDSIRELLRIAGEVRIFPLLELEGAQSRHLDAVLSVLQSNGYRVEIERVGYEFQRGGNQMMWIRDR